ncbi:Ig-like domain-containing protein, partial [Flavobacteriaceae bacterium]|nr:Ig-like domain-containing protein [Flavobacteriaceae bacterium]
MRNITSLSLFVLFFSFIGFSQNIVPVASNVSAATVKNTDASIHLVASDADFDSLIYSIVSDPSNGTVTLSGDTVTYTPTTDFTGTDTFTFKANDGEVDSSTKTVTIKVINEYLSLAQILSDIDGDAAVDQFGNSISFNEDATVMAIGAFGNDGNGTSSGHVRIYNYISNAWTQLGADIDGETAGDQSGQSVSLSSDGKTVAIGANNNDDNGANSGHVRIYNYNGTAWTQLGEDIDGEAASDYSGSSVSLSSDGKIVAIRAYGNDGNGTDSGHVRIYNYNGTAWTQLGGDINGEAAGDAIQDIRTQPLSISSDGKTVAIGAIFNDGNGADSGHVRIYNYNETAWTQVGADINGEATNDHFGWSISLSSDGKTIAIGAVDNDGNGSDSGHVRIHNYNGTAWTQLGADIDGEDANDLFGFSVSLSSDGKTVAIGANNNDSNGTDSGHVRIYNYSGSTWTQLGGDIDGEAAGDHSGYSVSLSSDGTTLAVGATENNGNGTNSGHVRVYTLVKINNKQPVASKVSAATVKNTNASIHLVASDLDFDALTYSIVSDPSNGTFTLSGDTVTYTPTTDFIGTDTFTFKANDGKVDSETKTVTIKVIKGYISMATQIGADIDGEAANDLSGQSVSFNEDATIMAIGALHNDGNGVDSGHVRVYQYSADSWIQLGEDINGEAAGDQSGQSVSLSSDGKTIAIGAIGNDGNGASSGHVRIYNYDGTSWIQIGSDIDGDAAGDFSGHSISLSSDGNTLAIGTPYNDGNGASSGHVKIYSYNGNSWTQLGEDIEGEAANDNSGSSVSLSSDGTTLAIGAYGNDGNGTGSGHVRIYNYNGSTWTQLGENINGEASSDYSGNSVSLSLDGNTVAIGAYQNDSNGSNSGHVRIYNYNGTAWTQLGTDIDGEAAGDQSGYSVSLSSDGTTLAIGAYLNAGNGSSSGHVRIYNYNGSAWTQLGADIDGEAAVDYSGNSVSLSSDGTTVAIGARRNDGNGADSGHVRVYSLVQINKIPVASNVSAATVKNTNASIHLVASDANFDTLTYSIVSEPSNGTATLSGDTVTYVPTTDFVGTDTFTFKANDEEVDSETKTVTIKVFKEYLSSVQFLGEINGKYANDQSGYSVSFNEDATIMAVGSYRNSGNGYYSGHVRVYQYSLDSWTQLGSDIYGEAARDQSSWSISLSSDGKTLAVGAKFNDGNGLDSGHVRIYNYNGTAWTQLGEDINGEAAYDYSGQSVSLSSDGKTLAIGAINNNGNGADSGHVRVYNYNGTEWTQLGGDIDGEASSEYSGHSVSLSSDGATVAIGASVNDGIGTDSGHVRIYNYNGTAWTQLGEDIDGEAAYDY